MSDLKKRVSKLLAKGLSVKEIAEALNLPIADVRALSKTRVAGAAPAKPAADTAARAALRNRMNALRIKGYTPFEIARELKCTPDEVRALIDQRDPNAPRTHAGWTIYAGGSAVGPSPASRVVGYGASGAEPSNFPDGFGGKRRI